MGIGSCGRLSAEVTYPDDDEEYYEASFAGKTTKHVADGCYRPCEYETHHPYVYACVQLGMGEDQTLSFVMDDIYFEEQGFENVPHSGSLLHVNDVVKLVHMVNKKDSL